MNFSSTRITFDRLYSKPVYQIEHYGLTGLYANHLDVVTPSVRLSDLWAMPDRFNHTHVLLSVGLNKAEQNISLHDL